MDEFSIKIRRRFPRRVFQWGGNKITRRGGGRGNSKARGRGEQVGFDVP